MAKAHLRTVRKDPTANRTAAERRNVLQPRTIHPRSLSSSSRTCTHWPVRAGANVAQRRSSIRLYKFVRHGIVKAINHPRLNWRRGLAWQDV